MRKTFSTVLISLIIATASGNFAVHAEPQTTSQETQEKLTHDTLLTTLSPHIQEAIANYYGYPKQFALYDTKILNITREQKGGFTFKVRAQVPTFEHAHGPSFGTETITISVSPFGVKIVSYVHQGDEWETKIDKFKMELLEDIFKTFNLDLSSFKKYEYRQLQYLTERIDGLKSLYSVNEEINNELNKDIIPPYKNFVAPFTFIKGDKAYILFKKADGTNFVYSLIKKDINWVIIKKESKQGKVMPKELLWYMFKRSMMFESNPH
ncbi:DUF3888 domain-containing protein [Paenibacillus sp. Soil750]|uniref:DUF3888 domain-containing protein n=1 Tax=Paenibacillus sp. Soil750 TaxID=1736398 RepID=UPI0006FA2A7A|nr:DUF3888 domain-containing protein [Paenibacillus sp. Soil750]KRE57454.1 hypothetical protein ASL11_31560 [Paenibacillus sp. Soil750]